MLTGAKVVLRARCEEDIAVLHREMSEDVELSMIASGGPWVPRSHAEALQGFRSDIEKNDPTKVKFAVDERASGELAGSCQLWGIDTHNRVAHLGFQLRPAFRGRGLGKDVIRTLCDYGFRVRGLHRLQVDTLASNAAACGAAAANGFVQEVRLRGNAFVAGEYTDEVHLGLLVHEWTVLTAK